MSDWHCSVDELAVCHRQQKECERAQEALSRVTSCFQQLVTSLGSSADSNFLREEMDQARGVAHQLCMGTDSRPSACLWRPSRWWPSSLCRSVAAPGSLVGRVSLRLIERGGQTDAGATVGSVPVGIRKFLVWSPDSLFSDWTFSSDTVKGQKLTDQHRSAQVVNFLSDGFLIKLAAGDSCYLNFPPEHSNYYPWSNPVCPWNVLFFSP